MPWAPLEAAVTKKDPQKKRVQPSVKKEALSTKKLGEVETTDRSIAWPYLGAQGTSGAVIGRGISRALRPLMGQLRGLGPLVIDC